MSSLLVRLSQKLDINSLPLSNFITSARLQSLTKLLRITYTNFSNKNISLNSTIIINFVSLLIITKIVVYYLLVISPINLDSNRVKSIERSLYTQSTISINLFTYISNIDLTYSTNSSNIYRYYFYRLSQLRYVICSLN